MGREELKQTLLQLQSQLQGDAQEASTSLDPETRALLQQVSNDVSGLLQASDTETAPVLPPEFQNDRDSVLDDLLGVTKQFEESHPKLAELIGQMASALSRIGI